MGSELEAAGGGSRTRRKSCRRTLSIVLDMPGDVSWNFAAHMSEVAESECEFMYAYVAGRER